MKSHKVRYVEGKRVLETEFLESSKECIELGRKKNSLVLIRCIRATAEFKVTPEILMGEHVLCPPEENEFTRHMRFASGLDAYYSVPDLLSRLERFFGLCLDVGQHHRFLLACFVLSTWLVDRLPVAPYMALVGLPSSGKSTALRALYLVCRRSLMTADVSSAAFYRICNSLTPTLLIDQTATAGQKRTLFHLLRVGITQDAIAFREGQSYHAYGAKVVAWTEMPDDDGLNSRCLIVPMEETSRTDLLRTSDPLVIEFANSLQNSLMYFRFCHRRKLSPPHMPITRRLRSRERDLYDALALPISESDIACKNLIYCLVRQQNFRRELLPAGQMATLASLFKWTHVQPEQESYALGQLKDEANINLAAAGERFRLNEKIVSSLLRTFGFLNRKRTNSGWVVSMDRAARERIHQLVYVYGASPLPTVGLGEPCPFCEALNSKEAAESQLTEIDFKPIESPKTQEDEEDAFGYYMSPAAELRREFFEDLKKADLLKDTDVGNVEHSERREHREHENDIGLQNLSGSEAVPAPVNRVPFEGAERTETEAKNGAKSGAPEEDVGWDDSGDERLKKEILRQIIERENRQDFEDS
jgi:hypothetical protein